MTLSSFIRYRPFCSCLSSCVLGNVRHHGNFSLRGRRCLRDRKRGNFKNSIGPLGGSPISSAQPNFISLIILPQKIWSKKTFHSLTNVNEKNYLCSIQSEQEMAIRKARTWDPRLLARDLLTATQATRMRKPVE